MRNCSHKWLVTYDDSTYIRELFPFAHIHEWKLMYGMNNVGKSTTRAGCELFISNYDVDEQSDHIVVSPHFGCQLKSGNTTSDPLLPPCFITLV